MALDKAVHLDLADEIQNLLRAAHGEGGDDEVAAPIQHALDAVGKVLQIVHVRFLVVAVAVGALGEHVVRLTEILRVVDEGLVEVADVPGKDHLFRDAALGQPDLDAGGAHQVAGVHIADDDALGHMDLLAVGEGAQVGDGGLCVLQGVVRRGLLRARAAGLAGLPLRVRLLDVGAVAQHDLAEVAGGGRGVDLGVAALLEQQRDPAGMVDVGVGQQDEVDGGGRHRHRRVDECVHALLHAAIHQSIMPVYLDQRAASRDLVGRT